MRDGEGVEEGLEDGELGRERVGIAGTQRRAVGGVVVVLEAPRGEGGEAGRTAAVHGCGGSSSGSSGDGGGRRGGVVGLAWGDGCCGDAGDNH